MAMKRKPGKPVEPTEGEKAFVMGAAQQDMPEEKDRRTKIRFSLRLDPEVKEMAEAAAKARGVNTTNLVSMAIVSLHRRMEQDGEL